MRTIEQKMKDVEPKYQEFIEIIREAVEEVTGKRKGKKTKKKKWIIERIKTGDNPRNGGIWNVRK